MIFPQNFAEPDPEQEFKGSDKIDTKITTFSGTLKKLLKLVLFFERDWGAIWKIQKEENRESNEHLKSWYPGYSILQNFLVR